MVQNVSVEKATNPRGETALLENTVLRVGDMQYTLERLPGKPTPSRYSTEDVYVFDPKISKGEFEESRMVLAPGPQGVDNVYVYITCGGREVLSVAYKARPFAKVAENRNEDTD